MVRVLALRLSGDQKICACSACRPREQEDAKRRHREREHLVHDRVRIENRIEALLLPKAFAKDLRCGRGRATSTHCERARGGCYRFLLRAELDRLRRRLELVLELIRELEAEREATLSAAAADRSNRHRRPPRFRWVAPTGAKPRERGIRVQGHPALTACKVTQPSLRYDNAPDFEAQASAPRKEDRMHKRD